MKAATFGAAFPKPVLCVLVRKVSTPTYSVTLDLPVREPIHSVATELAPKRQEAGKKQQLTA
jgi:hypothetical protein